MLANEPLELGDDCSMPSLLKITFEPPLEAGEAKLLEPRDLGLCEALVGELGKRLPTPERERVPRPVVGEALEALDIELPLCDPQPVAARLRLQAFLSKRLAEP